MLRLFQDPLRNLEATGITRERVEMMERNMKQDIITELQLYGNRLLLHEEEFVGNSFSIVVCFFLYEASCRRYIDS